VFKYSYILMPRHWETASRAAEEPLRGNCRKWSLNEKIKRCVNTTPRRITTMKALQHLALNCANMKKQEQFYSRHFGFRRARVFNANTPDEFVLLRLGSMCLADL
jgi:hypothetical protein